MDNSSSNPHNFEHNPRILADFFYGRAKILWFLSLGLKLFSALLGIVLVLAHIGSSLSPIFVFTLALCSELIQWQSDIQKGFAEALTRKIEYHNGFNWPFSPKDMRDSLSRVSKKNRDRISKKIEDNYFASKEEPSPRRVIENLRESAWWSSQQLGTVLLICVLVVATLIGGSLFTLSRSIETIDNYSSLANINRATTAVLSSVISLGLFKLIVGYYNFKSKADLIEQKATPLLKSENITEREAILLLHEYHLSRSSSPPIPSIVWRMKRKNLNELWDTYETKN